MGEIQNLKQVFTDRQTVLHILCERIVTLYYPIYTHDDEKNPKSHTIGKGAPSFSFLLE